MKSMTAVENGNESRRGAGLRLFAVVALCLLGMLLSGCPQPGQTDREIARRRDRVLQLNNQILLSDVDRALLLDRPSRLSDKRVP
jgi:hypothetical protein